MVVGGRSKVYVFIAVARLLILDRAWRLSARRIRARRWPGLLARWRSAALLRHPFTVANDNGLRALLAHFSRRRKSDNVAVAIGVDLVVLVGYAVGIIAFSTFENPLVGYFTQVDFEDDWCGHGGRVCLCWLGIRPQWA